MGHRELDDDLRPRWGSGRARGGSGAGARLSAKLAIRASVRLDARPRSTSRVSRSDGRQRVVVKTRFRLHGAAAGAAPGIGGAVQVAGNLRAHLAYIQREAAALDGGRPALQLSEAAAAEGVETAGDVIAAWRDDRHHYRIVISPENGSDLASMSDFTRDVMDAVGAKLGRSLEWVATVHGNTDQPHAHVVLRGVADGVQLTLDRQTISYGMREIAEELATQELGPRTLDQVREAFRAQVPLHRVTELDRALARGAEEGSVDLSQLRVSDEMRIHLAGRLQTLERMGLSEPVKGHVHRVSPDLLAVLRSAEERTRVATSAKQVLGDVRGLRSYTAESPEEAVAGRVVSTGLTEGGHRAYVALRTERGPVYVETDPRWAPRVDVGGVVEVRDRPAAEAPAARAAGGVEPRAEARADPGAPTTPEKVEVALKPLPPRLRVIAAADPSVGLREQRWSVLDGYVVKAQTPAWPGGADELQERLRVLDQAGLTYRDREGVTRFRRGVTGVLREAELGEATAREAAARGERPAPVGGERAGDWRVVGRVDLAQGPAVVLLREGVAAVELVRDVRQLTAVPAGAAVRVEREAGGRGVSLAPVAGLDAEVTR